MAPTRTGASYLNLITEEEKRIVRAIFDVYANLSGYEFVESPVLVPGGDDLMIGKGDFRAVSRELGPDSGVAGLANNRFAMVNGSLYNQSNRFFGDDFTNVMFHEIGHSLGLGHAYEQPANMGGGVPNDVLPGDHDIAHLQRIVPPNSTDIDMYRFELAEAGRFSRDDRRADVHSESAQYGADAYRQRSDGQREEIASNDRYFGSDSFIGLDLEPGVYFIGVSSTGNDNYDPNVPDSDTAGRPTALTKSGCRLKLIAVERARCRRDADRRKRRWHPRRRTSVLVPGQRCRYDAVCRSRQRPQTQRS